MCPLVCKRGQALVLNGVHDLKRITLFCSQKSFQQNGERMILLDKKLSKHACYISWWRLYLGAKNFWLNNVRFFFSRSLKRWTVTRKRRPKRGHIRTLNWFYVSETLKVWTTLKAWPIFCFTPNSDSLTVQHLCQHFYDHKRKMIYQPKPKAFSFKSSAGQIRIWKRIASLFWIILIHN